MPKLWLPFEGIDFKNADSKVLKTLALCWVYRKRAFAVSGAFRKVLADLITNLHNSNKPLLQTTLTGEIIHEEQYYPLKFVNGQELEIDKDTWFILLNSEQLRMLADCLKEKSNF
jgi:hypothetical protein